MIKILSEPVKPSWPRTATCDCGRLLEYEQGDVRYVRPENYYQGLSYRFIECPACAHRLVLS